MAEAHGTDRNSRAARAHNAWRLRVETEFFHLPPTRRVLLSQLPLTLTALVVLVFLLLIDPRLVTDTFLVAGAAGLMALTAAAAWVPWHRLPNWGTWIIPLADFVPIGAMVHGTNGNLNGISLLSVFPVLWLAWSDISARATRAVAFLATLAIAWAPFLFAGDVPSVPGLLKPLLIPIIMLALAVAATVVTRSLYQQAQRLEEASQEAQLRAGQLDSILNVANVGVVVVDAEGHDQLMNRRQQDFHALAVPPDRDDPTEAELLVFEHDRCTPARADARPVRRAVMGEEFSDELYWLGSGRRQRAMSTSARQIIDEQGARQGAVVVFHDVTEVVEAAEAQEQFVANVSHELRTPLTSILGYLDLAAEEGGDGPVQQYLSVVSRNAERLLALVNDLLSTANGATQVTAGQGDLYDVLSAAVEAARPRADLRGIELRLDAEPGMLGSFDARRLDQAVDNLISNALKFSPGSTVVEVAGRRQDAQLLVCVKDQGPGMSAEEQAKLFTRFYRTHSARQAGVPGTGLGLSVTKAIAAGHGGTLAVHSVPGRGSTFTLAIPAGTR